MKVNPNRFKANNSEIWKRPREIRYIWYVELDDGNVYIGATYNSFDKALQRGIVHLVKICDVRSNIIYPLHSGEIEIFKTQWKENYFNVNWKYK